MLSPSSSLGSIRDRRRAPMHPGVRVPFPNARRSQPQDLKDAVYSQPTTIGQAIDQISYLINNEIYRFDELASSMKNVYGVDLAYGNSHVGLSSMLGNVSLDVPYGSNGKPSFASDNQFQSPDSFHVRIVPSHPVSFSAKPLERSESYKSQAHTIPPTLALDHLPSGHDAWNVQSDANEPHPTQTTKPDHLSVMPLDIFDPDTSLSSSTTNESYNENLHDWLQTQGTQTQINDHSHRTPPSPQPYSPSEECCVIGETPTVCPPAPDNNSINHHPSQRFHLISPPPTVRLHKTSPRVSASASGSPRLSGSNEKFASPAGLGLLLSSHPDCDDGISSLMNAHVPNPNTPNPHHTFGTKWHQQHLDNDSPHATPLSNAVQNQANRPPPIILHHLMHVIEELKLKSTENNVDAAIPPSEKAELPTEHLETANGDLNCKLPSVTTEGVKDGRESVKTVGKRLLEQGLLQEEQAQRLRILAEALCEIALWRRTLSGMLCSKYETET